MLIFVVLLNKRTASSKAMQLLLNLNNYKSMYNSISYPCSLIYFESLISNYIPIFVQMKAINHILKCFFFCSVLSFKNVSYCNHMKKNVENVKNE